MSVKDEEKYASVVTLEEIAENDYNLNISRYVITIEEEEPIDLAAEVKKLRELETKRAEAEKVMNDYLQELGIEF